MPVSDNFDKEAMERKIKKNLEIFTIEQIGFELMGEKIEVLKSIQVKEARAAELEDQIIYMNEYYKKEKT